MWWCSLRRGEGGIKLDWIGWDKMGWDGIEKEEYGLRLKRWMKLWSYDYGFCGAVKRCLKMV